MKCEYYRRNMSSFIYGEESFNLEFDRTKVHIGCAFLDSPVISIDLIPNLTPGARLLTPIRVIVIRFNPCDRFI